MAATPVALLLVVVAVDIQGYIEIQPHSLLQPVVVVQEHHEALPQEAQEAQEAVLALAQPVMAITPQPVLVVAVDKIVLAVLLVVVATVSVKPEVL